MFVTICVHKHTQTHTHTHTHTHTGDTYTDDHACLYMVLGVVCLTLLYTVCVCVLRALPCRSSLARATTVYVTWWVAHAAYEATEPAAVSCVSCSVHSPCALLCAACCVISVCTPALCAPQAAIKPAVIEYLQTHGHKHFLEPGNEGVVVVHVQTGLQR